MKKSAALAFAIILVLSSSVYAAGGAVHSVSIEKKAVALTFDDGPHPMITPKILDILEKYGARATFFVIGQNAKYYPDQLRMAAEFGHEIGNHTYSHKSLAKMGRAEIEREISSAEEEILAVCGAKTKLFRPSEGCLKTDVISAARELSYDVILWSVDTRDWQHRPTADIVANIKKNVRPGSIILFHDYISGAAHTGDVLEIILPYLISEGYEFVTVSELIEMERES